MAPKMMKRSIIVPLLSGRRACVGDPPDGTRSARFAGQARASARSKRGNEVGTTAAREPPQSVGGRDLAEWLGRLATAARPPARVGVVFGRGPVIYLHDRGDDRFGYALNLNWPDWSEWGDTPF